MVVYFITDEEFIKIGIAKDVKQRIRFLQTGNPRKLRILKTIECKDEIEARVKETELHSLCRKSRAYGEWFKKTDEVYSCLGFRENNPYAKTSITHSERNDEFTNRAIDIYKRLLEVERSQNEVLRTQLEESEKHSVDFLELYTNEQKQNLMLLEKMK